MMMILEMILEISWMHLITFWSVQPVLCFEKLKIQKFVSSRRLFKFENYFKIVRKFRNFSPEKIIDAFWDQKRILKLVKDLIAMILSGQKWLFCSEIGVFMKNWSIFVKND